MIFEKALARLKKVVKSDHRSAVRVRPMSDAAESAEIYQFRIVIRDRIPQLWRRVQFSRNVTLARFHLTFQTAFGWSRTGVPRSGWALGFRAAEVVAAAHRMM